MSKIEIPECLPYPKIATIQDTPELRNKFCYVLRAYPQQGIIMMVIRQAGDVCMRMFDFEAKMLDLEKDNGCLPQIIEQSPKIVKLMKLIGIPKALLYFSDDKGIPRLVDVRLSLNKFVGPGFLNDFFGKVVPTQERVADPLVLSDEIMEMVPKCEGVFSQDVVVKPSAFKTIIRKEEMVPLYGVHYASGASN